ncbi:hypothetical protein HF888_11390 [Bermanella marisrubri]|nr:hypothetical protein [Bermanella marisrubri]QIZ84786.1 hypothetical protein HF888_11390 [Bermanella marisrubri]
MKIYKILFTLLFLIVTFSVKAEEARYSQEQLINACNYLGGFCEIAKNKCRSEKSRNLEKCLVDFAIEVMNRQRIPQDPADLRNQKYAQIACEKLGDECDFIKLECLAGGGLFNACIAMSYFSIEVSKELCGVMGYKACLDRDRDFGVKVIHELTIPNIGKPIRQTMLNECNDAGNYKVKSMELKKFYYGYMKNLQYLKEPIRLSDEDDYEHKIQEEYYNCMKAVLEKAS